MLSFYSPDSDSLASVIFTWLTDESSALNLFPTNTMASRFGILLFYSKTFSAKVNCDLNDKLSNLLPRISVGLEPIQVTNSWL